LNMAGGRKIIRSCNSKQCEMWKSPKRLNRNWATSVNWRLIIYTAIFYLFIVCRAVGQITIICPPDTTVSCASNVPPAADNVISFELLGGSITWDCGMVINISHFDAITDSICPDKFTLTRTYIAADTCGSTPDSCFQIIYVESGDFAANMPANDSSTVACATDAIVPVPPSVVDYCGNPITPTGPTVGGTYVTCDGTITYTWTYTDCAGYTQLYVHTVTIAYQPFPAISPTTDTVDCYGNIVLPAPPTVYDNCGVEITDITGPVEGTIPECEGEVTYTWTYTDCAGYTQLYVHTVTIAYQPFPAISPTTDTVDCYDNIVLPIPPTVYDNCGVEITDITGPVEGIVPECEGEVTYTWTYTDCAGHSQLYVHTVTIAYQPFPAISPTTDTVDCYDNIVLPDPPTVYDNCGVEITDITGPVEGIVPECEGELTYTWTYTDCAGHSQLYVHTVTIAYQPFPAISPTTDTVDCYDNIVLPDPPTVYDNCGVEITDITGPVEGIVPECEGELTYTWTYTDCAGHSQLYVHTVTIAYQPFPAISPTTDTVDCYGNIVLPAPPTVYDNCGVEITDITGPVEGTIPECEGEVTYTWTYTDCAGYTQLYVHTVTIAYQPFPAISPTTDTVDCYDNIVLPIPPTVYDNCGVEITDITGPVEGIVPECEGEVTYTWTYTDCAGHSQLYVHTVTIAYQPFPAISPTTDTVDCYDNIVLPDPPTVYDNCGVEITDITGPVEGIVPECEGELTYTWTYTDCAGHSQLYVHTVTIAYQPFPAISPTTGIVDCYDNIVLPIPPAVYDNCGVEITDITGPVEGTIPECEGEVTYTWTYTDCAGHSQLYVHTVTIAYQPFPAISPTTDIVDCYDNIVLPIPPAVYDNCGVEITDITGPVEGTIPECEGEVTYTWTYTDCAGHSQLYVHTVTIAYQPFPAISPTTDTVDCYDNIVLPAPPTVYDNCGVEITDITGPVEGTIPECEGEVTYTWTYTDCAGYTQLYVHTVTIVYQPFPAIPPTTSVVDCYDNITLPDPPTVYDNCGVEITDITGPVEGTIPECEGEVTYTWTYTDYCAGYTQLYVHTVTIAYQPFPAISPTTGIVDCYDNIVLPDPPTVYDNCGVEITDITGPVEGTIPECEGELTYTWTYTDCAGYSHDWIYTYHVNDSIPPTASNPSNVTGITCINLIPAADPSVVTDEEDNCGIVTVTFHSESHNGGSGCATHPYILTRVYRVTDACGNFIDVSHTITVIDNEPPFFINCPSDITVETANDIPVPASVTYSDCGITTTIIPEFSDTNTFREISFGLEAEPGYCPDSIYRYYYATDPCGNKDTCLYKIYITGDTLCELCQDNVLYFPVNLSASPFETDTVASVERTGLCCDAAAPSRCAAFDFILHPDAIGIMIEICGSGGPNNICPSGNWETQGQLQAGDWSIDCEPAIFENGILCLSGATFFTLTHCKPGGNNLHYRFTAIAGAIATGPTVTRVDCYDSLTVTGVNNPSWNSIYPGDYGAYNHFLSCTDCYDPVFTPIPDTIPPIDPIPEYVVYEVCGDLPDSLCGVLGIDCTIITVNIYPAIALSCADSVFQFCSDGISEDWQVPIFVSPPSGYYINIIDPNGLANQTYYENNYIYTPPANLSGTYQVFIKDLDHAWGCDSAEFVFYVEFQDCIICPPKDTICHNENITLENVSDFIALGGILNYPCNIQPGTFIVNSESNGESCPEIITYTVHLTDICGNYASCWFELVRGDFEAPTANALPAIGPFACYADIPAPDINDITGINDNCGPVAVEFISDTPDPGCFGTVIRTYRLSDFCNNVTFITQTIIIEYSGALTPPVNGSGIVACPEHAVDPGPPIDILDACGRTVSPFLIGKEEIPDPVNCEGVITWRYRYIACDSLTTADWVFTYTVQYVPFNPILPTTDTVDCYDNIVLPIPPTVYDNCGAEITDITGPVEGAVPECEGEVTYTWTYTDCAGYSQLYVHTVTIAYQPFPAISPTTDTVDCYDNIVLPAPPTVYDNCGAEITDITGPVEGDRPRMRGRGDLHLDIYRLRRPLPAVCPHRYHRLPAFPGDLPDHRHSRLL
jgi:hypothetical protein